MYHLLGQSACTECPSTNETGSIGCCPGNSEQWPLSRGFSLGAQLGVSEASAFGPYRWYRWYIDDIDGIVVSTNSVCNPLYDSYSYKNMLQLCSYRYFVRSDQSIANINLFHNCWRSQKKLGEIWGNMSCLSPDPLVKCGHWVVRPLDARVAINLQWWYFWPLPISCNVPGWAYPLAKVPVWCMRWAIVRRPPGWDLSRHRKCKKKTRKTGMISAMAHDF